MTEDGGVKLQIKPAEALDADDVEEMRAELDRMVQDDDNASWCVSSALRLCRLCGAPYCLDLHRQSAWVDMPPA